MPRTDSVCLSSRSDVMCGEWTHVSQLYNFEALQACHQCHVEASSLQVQLHSGVPLTSLWQAAEAGMAPGGFHAALHFLETLSRRPALRWRTSPGKPRLGTRSLMRTQLHSLFGSGRVIVSCAQDLPLLASEYSRPLFSRYLVTHKCQSSHQGFPHESST